MIKLFKDVAVHSLDCYGDDEKEWVADCYGIACDGCGELYEHSDYGCDKMTDECELIDDALSYGEWRRFFRAGDSEYHFCPKCCREIECYDSEGYCDDGLYEEADIPLDKTHVERLRFFDGDLISTQIATKDTVC